MMQELAETLSEPPRRTTNRPNNNIFGKRSQQKIKQLRAIQLSDSSHLMLKSLFCPSDLQIAILSNRSDLPARPGGRSYK